MNIVFFGTSEFAVESLRAILQSSHKVLLVVTQPDRKKGRKLVLSAPPVKALAEAHGIRVYQPEDASDYQSAAFLKDVHADLFVVVAFGQILKKEMISIPKLYSINLHGSLLPKYRGAAPTNWAVINGDRTTGVTVIRLNEKMDAGDIITALEVPIDDEETNVTLSETLADVGAKLLVETIDSIATGAQMSFIKQDSSKVTSAPKLQKEDGLIGWHDNTAAIHNRVRGLLPWPSAYTYLSGKVLKILRTEIPDQPQDMSAVLPGTVIDIVKKRGMLIRTGSGSILVTHVQLEGGKELDVDAFLRGHKVEKGYRFGS